MQSIDRFLNPNIAEIKEISATESQVILEPLSVVLVHTLGNALRRVLRFIY